MDPGRFLSLTVAVYFAIVNPHQNLRRIFSIFHLSECVIERITLSHIQGCISRRFHFDELQNNKRIRNQEEASMGKADVNVNIWLSEKNRFANLFNGVIYGGENVILPEDLQVILTMLRYRDSKEELKHYIDENKKFFQNVDYETSQAMKAFLNMKQIPGETEQKEETVDMCKAIQEMYDDGVKDGIQRGIAATIRTCQNLNASRIETFNNIRKEYKLTEEQTEEYLNTYWK